MFLKISLLALLLTFLAFPKKHTYSSGNTGVIEVAKSAASSGSMGVIEIAKSASSSGSMG